MTNHECPTCGVIEGKTQVLKTYTIHGDIYRHRSCPKCSTTFFTQEIFVSQTPPALVTALETLRHKTTRESKTKWNQE